jgi:hypothetical protein
MRIDLLRFTGLVTFLSGLPATAHRTHCSSHRPVNSITNAKSMVTMLTIDGLVLQFLNNFNQRVTRAFVQSRQIQGVQP